MPANDQLGRYLSGFLRKPDTEMLEKLEPAVISLMLCTQAGISKSNVNIPSLNIVKFRLSVTNDAGKRRNNQRRKKHADYYQTSTLIGGDGIHLIQTAHQKIADQ